MSKDYTKLRRIDLKDIKDDKDVELGKDNAQEKTTSQANLGLTYQRLT